MEQFSLSAALACSLVSQHISANGITEPKFALKKRDGKRVVIDDDAK